MEDLKTWRCGRCGLAIDLPDHDTERDRWVAAMSRIREHRFAHIVTAFEGGSDAALDGLCEDDSEPSEPFVPSCWAEELMDTVVRAVGDEPVDSDDVTPVLEGIAELLRADLPRARRLWYPVNEDGGFNR